jgi:hypothetical protein
LGLLAHAVLSPGIHKLLTKPERKFSLRALFGVGAVN